MTTRQESSIQTIDATASAGPKAQGRNTIQGLRTSTTYFNENQESKADEGLNPKVALGASLSRTIGSHQLQQ